MTTTAEKTRPSDLSAVDAAAAIKSGELSSQELTRSCLDRIAERDDAVKAWAHLDAEKAMAEARAADNTEPTGLLHGVPVGIKDIIDVAGMPTGFNSPIYPGYVPVADAACAAMIRNAGGFILGKTVSTEFGNRHPGPTRNPYDPARTPGGSSQGSAAAVGDRQVPLGIGTQTSGSIIRPTAFCGAVGYKPSFGEISRVGVKQQSGSLDTLGLCGRTIADVELLRAALIGIPYKPEMPFGFGFRVGVCRPADWKTAEPCSQDAVEGAAEDIAAAGGRVVDLELPDDLFLGWLDDHKRIANFEAARNYGHEKTLFKEKLSKDLYDGRITSGEKCPYEKYVTSQRRAEAMRAWIDDAFSDIDVILTLASAGEAPRSLTDTGDARFNSLWTMTYTPCVTLPRGKGPHGMPIAVQLVGRQYDDERLFAIAKSVESLF
jgi:Asp-tRNA(Asn)/Glu-tRNA(Gln) amidotransferase A subunit family amidase